jgi:predicted nucleic acid-binding protein
VIYLDSSALVKLVFEEPESNALAQWLADRDETPKISSQLATIELIRACRRRDEEAVAEARVLLEGIDLVPLTGDLIEHAAAVGPRELRSLDAIHLASARSIREDVTALVAYAARLQTAAVAAGFQVAAPA